MGLIVKKTFLIIPYKNTQMVNINPRTKHSFLFGLFLSLVFNIAWGQRDTVENPTNQIKIGVVEHLDEFLPKDIYLIGEDGKKVILTDLIDKPTVLNFIYYQCPGICSPLMEGLATVMDKSDLVPGKDYQVFTISFDPSETIGLAKMKKANYLNLLSRKEEVAKGWHFFVSDSVSIAKATGAVGFKYIRTGNDFMHAASVMVISPDGKITRYLNGIYFRPFEFKMAILEANKGKSFSAINSILQYCYSYDPQQRTYVFNITKVGGTAILLLAALTILFVVLLTKTRKTS